MRGQAEAPWRVPRMSGPWTCRRVRRERVELRAIGSAGSSVTVSSHQDAARELSAREVMGTGTSAAQVNVALLQPSLVIGRWRRFASRLPHGAPPAFVRSRRSRAPALVRPRSTSDRRGRPLNAHRKLSRAVV